MARARSFDDEEVVLAARELFWELGYTAVSLADLQRVTGLSRSSLYAAYGSKRGLYDRAAKSYLEEIVDPLLGPMEMPGAGLPQLVGFFIAMALVMRSPDTRIAKRGCFMVNMMIELEELDPAASDMVREYRQRVHSAILNALVAGPDKTDLSARADALTASHLGIVTMARVDPSGAARASETIAADIEKW